MKNKINVFIALTLLLMGVVVWLSPINVSAKKTADEDEAQNPVITITNPPSKDSEGIKKLCAEVNSRIHEKGIWKSSGDEEHFKDPTAFFSFTDGKETDTEGNVSYLVNVEVNMIAYRQLGTSQKQTVMQETLSAISNTDNVSRTNKNKLYNHVCKLDESTSSLVRNLSSDVNADFYTAYSWLKPVFNALSKILGVVSLFIFVMLSLTMVIDIAYITVPGFQLFLDNMGNFAGKHFGKHFINPEGRSWVVSLEARKAVMISEQKAGQEYVNPVNLYFSMKTKQLIALAICLLYLVSGHIYNLVAAIIDYLSLVADSF